MRRQVQILLIAPQHVRPRLHHRFTQHVMQVDDLISSSIAHEHEHRAFVVLHPILHERAYARVHFLPHRARVRWHHSVESQSTRSSPRLLARVACASTVAHRADDYRSRGSLARARAVRASIARVVLCRVASRRRRRRRRFYASARRDATRRDATDRSRAARRARWGSRARISAIYTTARRKRRDGARGRRSSCCKLTSRSIFFETCDTSWICARRPGRGRRF